MAKKPSSSPPSRRKKNDKKLSPRIPLSPTPNPLKVVKRSPDASSEPYSNIIMKVYMHKKLYSIYDRATKDYIYHSKQELHDGFTVAYSKDGYCTAIYDKAGNEVYTKGDR
ncbi:hypothetical protein F4782DRAFT_524859 [Xylaria castorea]|nr:hypothetical protein F4782DRAFT_524859 [Xylaria castorea]